MRKYNYFDDNDIQNSIYDDPMDPYNIIHSIANMSMKSYFKDGKNIFAPVLATAKGILSKAKRKEIHIGDIKKDIKDIKNIKNIELPEIHFDEKSKHKLRFLPFVLFVVFIVIFIAIFVNSIESENEKIAQFNASASDVCIDKINTFGVCNFEKLDEDEYGKNLHRLTGTCFVRELDFDNNGISELLVTYSDGGVYFNEVWGFDGDQFISLYNKEANFVADKTKGSWITLYRHNNKYYIGTNATDDGAEVDLYTLKGDSFDKKYTCQYDFVTETFTIKKKQDVVSFERIELSCISQRLGNKRVDEFTKATEVFASSQVISAANLAKDDTQKMHQAYYALVQEYNNNYGISTFNLTENTASLSGLGVVKIVDFNGDDVDELMLIYQKSVGVRDEDRNGNYISVKEDRYYCDIFRWTGQKAVRAFQHEGLSGMQDNGTDTLFILKHQDGKTYYCANTYVVENKGKSITSSSKIYELTDINFETTYKAIMRNSYGSVTRTIDGDKVSKTDFEASKDTVALFCNDNEYNTEIFTVGYVKRKSADSADVEKQVNETINEIRKLNKQYVHE